jgi:hypothetical protein
LHLIGSPSGRWCNVVLHRPMLEKLQHAHVLPPCSGRHPSSGQRPRLARPTTKTGEQVSDRIPSRSEPASAPRKIWIAPTVIDLPRLENLTLQTGGTIPGDPSVFP